MVINFLLPVWIPILFLTLSCLASLPASAGAQESQNVDFLFKMIEEKNSTPKDSTRQRSIPSGMQYLGMGMIRFYQLFISTQDKPSCIFELSCSNFGMNAVRQRGFLIGTLLTADRLTRCNSLARDDYQTDPITQRAIDPVIFYEFRNR